MKKGDMLLVKISGVVKNSDDVVFMLHEAAENMDKVSMHIKRIDSSVFKNLPDSEDE